MNLALKNQRLIYRGLTCLDYKGSNRAITDSVIKKPEVGVDAVCSTRQNVAEALVGKPIIYRRADNTLFPMKIGDHQIPVYSRYNLEIIFQQQIAWCKTLTDVHMQFEVPSDVINGDSCAQCLIRLAEKDHEMKGRQYKNADLLKSELLEQLFDNIEKDLQSITNENLIDLCRWSLKSSDTEVGRRSTFVEHLVGEVNRKLKTKDWSVSELIKLSNIFVKIRNGWPFRKTLSDIWSFLSSKENMHLLTVNNICLMFGNIPVEIINNMSIKSFAERFEDLAWSFNIDDILQVLEHAKRIRNMKRQLNQTVIVRICRATAQWAMLNIKSLVDRVEEDGEGHIQMSIVTFLEYYLQFGFFRDDLNHTIHKYCDLKEGKIHPDLMATLLEYTELGFHQQKLKGNSDDNLLVSASRYLKNYSKELSPRQFYKIFTNYSNFLEVKEAEMPEEVLLSTKNYLLEKFDKFSTSEALEILAITTRILQGTNFIFHANMMKLECINRIMEIEDPILKGRALLHYSYCSHPFTQIEYVMTSKWGIVLEYFIECFQAYENWPEQVKMATDFSRDAQLKVEELMEELFIEENVNYMKNVTTDHLPFKIPFVIFTDHKRQVLPMTYGIEPQTKLAIVFVFRRSSSHPAGRKWRFIDDLLIDDMLRSSGYKCIVLKYSLHSTKVELNRLLVQGLQEVISFS